MTLSSLPGPWRWERRDVGWWRVNDRFQVADGPHPRPIKTAVDDIVPAPTWDEVADRFADDFRSIPHWVPMAKEAWKLGDYVFDAQGIVQRRIDLP